MNSTCKIGLAMAAMAALAALPEAVTAKDYLTFIGSSGTEVLDVYKCRVRKNGDVEFQGVEGGSWQKSTRTNPACHHNGVIADAGGDDPRVAVDHSRTLSSSSVSAAPVVERPDGSGCTGIGCRPGGPIVTNGSAPNVVRTSEVSVNGRSGKALAGANNCVALSAGGIMVIWRDAGRQDYSAAEASQNGWFCVDGKLMAGTATNTGPIDKRDVPYIRR